jgi:hypothetical protein
LAVPADGQFGVVNVMSMVTMRSSDIDLVDQTKLIDIGGISGSKTVFMAATTPSGVVSVRLPAMQMSSRVCCRVLHRSCENILCLDQRARQTVDFLVLL